MKQLNKARDTIWREGYEDGRGENAIWYYCAICGKPVKPDSKRHKAIIEYMRQHGTIEAATRGRGDEVASS